MKIIIYFFAMISCTVVANLLMKTGASSLVGKGLSFISLLQSWRLLVGLFLFGCAALIYILILRLLPLNVAQSFASAQFIAVILSSYIFLSEAISLVQWIGILFITIGIAVVGVATSA